MKEHSEGNVTCIEQDDGRLDFICNEYQVSVAADTEDRDEVAEIAIATLVEAMTNFAGANARRLYQRIALGVS